MRRGALISSLNVYLAVRMLIGLSFGATGQLKTHIDAAAAGG